MIAIIAILAAILFPVFAQARQAAQKTVCLSNLKQMGLAITLYSDDYEQVLPMDSHSGGSQHSWFTTLQPYAKSKLVFRCPSDTSVNFEHPLPGRLVKRQSTYGTNFYMTAYLPGEEDPLTSETSGFTSLTQIVSPARTIYIAEMKRNSVADHFHPAWWYTPNPDFLFENPDDALWKNIHSGKSNYVFLDGHAKSMAFDQTFSGDRRVDLYDPRRE